MRLAVIADVHANAPALEAVLEAVTDLRPDRLVCLGDLVGYNAEPAPCVARVRALADVVVAGNHDIDCLRVEAAEGTSPTARRVQAWTRAQLSVTDTDWLGRLPSLHVDPMGFVAVHGCYLNSTYHTGYVTGTMLEANLRAVVARPEWPRLALCGHTHVPLLGWLSGSRCEEPPFRGTLKWPADADAVLVNPGSVGQPRDGDTRASFVLLDLEERTAELRRVAYDVEKTVAALRAAGLPPELGNRLREGR